MGNVPTFFAVSDGEQLRLLNAQLQYAAENSRFYRESLHGFTPLTRLDQLRDLPFTTGAQLRTRGREMLCVGQREIQRIVSLCSSGTSGERKRLYFSREDLEQTVRFFTQGMGLLCGAGDRVAVLFPRTSPDGLGDLLCRGLAGLGALPVGMPEGGELPALCALLRALRPQTIVGMPALLRRLALLLPELRPKTVLLSADYVSASLGRLLEDVWKCAVFRHYGMTELGYGCAVEGPERRGMLPRRDCLLLEIVDAAGNPLPEHTPGEIVVTTLRRRAMPLLRYRTGDLGIMGEGKLLRALGRREDPLSPALAEALEGEVGLLDYALAIEKASGRAVLRLETLEDRTFPETRARALLGGLLPRDMELIVERYAGTDPLTPPGEKRRCHYI